MLQQKIAPAPDRVVLLHDFSQALGGASHLVQVLIAQLRDRGISVTFFAGDDGAQFRRHDVEFIPLHGRALLQRSKLGALAGGLYNRHVFLAVRAWIDRHDTPGTVYHLHGWSKILTPAVFRALRPVASRLILHAHDFFNGCPNGAFFDYPAGRDCALRPLSGECLRRQCDKSSYAEKLWRVSREALRRGLNGGTVGGNRMLLIHPGQMPNFARAQWPGDRLHAVRNPVTPPCIARVAAERNRGVIFIGRISAEKGADLAARAAAQASLPITFVGEGSEMDRVRSLNPGARFLGRLNREGVAQALSSARVAVMPSRWSEPFGLVALEAAGSGVPVIVNSRALIAQEVDRAGFGMAMDTSNVPAFAARLAQLHVDDATVEAMSRAGHAGYRRLCNSDESWAEEVLGHYRGALDALRGREVTA